MFRLVLAALSTAMVALPLHSAVASVQSGVEKYRAGDYSGAIADWLPHAALSDPNALFNLGQAYRLGHGVPADLAIAADYYRRAADLGHAAAAANLGALLVFGEEPLRDRETGLRHLRAAARAEDPNAQLTLAVLHFNGELVQKDWPRAYAYALLAERNGLAEASEKLAEMRRHMPAAVREDASRILGELVEPGPSAAFVPLPASSAGLGEIVSTVAYTPPRAQAAPADHSGPWRAQVGAFSSPATAENYAAELKGLLDPGDAALPVYLEQGSGMVRLQIGAFSSRAETSALCARISAAGRPCFPRRTVSTGN